MSVELGTPTSSEDGGNTLHDADREAIRDGMFSPEEIAELNAAFSNVDKDYAEQTATADNSATEIDPVTTLDQDNVPKDSESQSGIVPDANSELGAIFQQAKDNGVSLNEAYSAAAAKQRKIAETQESLKTVMDLQEGSVKPELSPEATAAREQARNNDINQAFAEETARYRKDRKIAETQESIDKIMDTQASLNEVMGKPVELDQPSTSGENVAEQSTENGEKSESEARARIEAMTDKEKADLIMQLLAERGAVQSQVAKLQEEFNTFRNSGNVSGNETSAPDYGDLGHETRAERRKRERRNRRFGRKILRSFNWLSEEARDDRRKKTLEGKATKRKAKASKHQAEAEKYEQQAAEIDAKREGRERQIAENEERAKENARRRANMANTLSAQDNIHRRNLRAQGNYR